MLRFTIRDLHLATIIAAMGVGWWLDHSRLTRAWLDAKRKGEHDHWAAEVSTRVTRSDAGDGRITVFRTSPTSITVWWKSPGASSSCEYYFPDMPNLPASGWPTFLALGFGGCCLAPER